MPFQRTLGKFRPRRISRNDGPHWAGFRRSQVILDIPGIGKTVRNDHASESRIIRFNPTYNQKRVDGILRAMSLSGLLVIPADTMDKLDRPVHWRVPIRTDADMKALAQFADKFDSCEIDIPAIVGRNAVGSGPEKVRTGPTKPPKPQTNNQHVQTSPGEYEIPGKRRRLNVEPNAAEVLASHSLPYGIIRP